MAIISPRVYFGNENYRDPLGAVLEGMDAETQRRENLKDQRAKRAVAQQLADNATRQEYLDEVKAGFHQAGGGAGPTMKGSATTGATGDDVFTLGEGIDDSLASRVAGLRGKVGGLLGERGPTDAERLAQEEHGYRADEQQAEDAAQAALHRMDNDARMGQLKQSDEDAFARTQATIAGNLAVAKLREKGETQRIGLQLRQMEKGQEAQDRLYAAGAVSQAEQAARDAEAAIPHDLSGQLDVTSPEAQHARQLREEADRMRKSYQALLQKQVPGFQLPTAAETAQRATEDFASQYQATTDPAQRYAALQDYYRRLHAVNSAVPENPPTPDPNAGMRLAESNPAVRYNNATPAQKAALDQEQQLYAAALAKAPQNKTAIEQRHQQRIQQIMSGQPLLSGQP